MERHHCNDIDRIWSYCPAKRVQARSWLWTVGLIAGGLVGKGKVVADWPGWKQAISNRDLMATIDYRSVCAACLSATFGLNHETVASEVFFDKKIPNINEHLFS